MKAELDCIPCIVQQTVDTVRFAVRDPKVQRQAINEVLRYLQEASLEVTPPELGREVYRILKQITGIEDPYREIKLRCNRTALEIYDEMKRIVYKNSHPLQTAAKLAITGNIIDFGQGQREIDIQKEIREVNEMYFAIDHFEQFLEDLARVKKILYLADNAGEIVFDKLFIEVLRRFYPERNHDITVVVRGSPIINDATLEDARMVGLHQLARVIDNGDSAPATLLDRVSEEMKMAFRQAELVIAKGQGNYETLDHINDKLIYFFLRTKCPLISRRLGVAPDSLVLKRNQ